MTATSFTLLDRLRATGDQQAWNRFVELYAPLLHHWARASGLPANDAADLVQEVFLLLVTKLPEYTGRDGGSFRGWLRAVLQNKWRDWLRRVRFRPRTGAAEQLSELAAADPDPFWEVDHRRYLIDRALRIMQSDFQPTTWRACWECVVNGRSGHEVGMELGLSEAAVYVAKSRVLRRLRAELGALIE